MKNARAYILLDILDGRSEQVVRNLRGKPGIVAADSLDGRPDIILIVEGADRQELAGFIMPVLASIDNVTEDIRLMVTREDSCGTTRSTKYDGRQDAQRETYRCSC